MGGGEWGIGDGVYDLDVVGYGLSADGNLFEFDFSSAARCVDAGGVDD